MEGKKRTQEEVKEMINPLLQEMCIDTMISKPSNVVRIIVNRSVIRF
jgi:hypothetical protein